ncbi:hypothetical protein KUTeg_007338 [Tegillarca granosa]|uniref:FAD-binding FR-type domain-containing protein n=1 Tax=Tegillarca granosa TaxID=220873 RepID=A0ABQ9FCZ7_TEGGR|nr:hypothetical protein KUTeg_007338 [Tegillarca granosa]
MRQENVMIDYTDGQILLTLYIQEYIYYVHIELEDLISDKFNVKIHKETGKTEICLQKMSPGVQWKCIGKYLDKHNKFIKISEQDIIYKRCTLESVSEVTHDTKLLGLTLPQGCRMCVPLGYHVHIKHNISGMEVVRSYTVVLPSLHTEQQDSRVLEGRLFYLMIKIYKDGTLTPWIDTLSIGDELDISNYDGNFIENRFHCCKQLILFAAGTGFTPMIRLIYQCLTDSTSDRQVKLIFFNKTEKDILWNDQLDSLSSQSDRFSVHYILSEPGNSWTGLKGRVNKEMMKMFLPKKTDMTETNSDKSSSSSSDILICACGPTQFTKAVQQYTEDLGYNDSFHAFLG